MVNSSQQIKSSSKMFYFIDKIWKIQVTIKSKAKYNIGIRNRDSLLTRRRRKITSANFLNLFDKILL